MEGFVSGIILLVPAIVGAIAGCMSLMSCLWGAHKLAEKFLLAMLSCFIFLLFAGLIGALVFLGMQGT